MGSSGNKEKKTPPRVVELIKGEVSKLGQNGAAKAIKIPLFSLQRYMAGTTEPTQASLKKLADYFGVSVAWLRGERLWDICEEVIYEGGRRHANIEDLAEYDNMIEEWHKKFLRQMAEHVNNRLEKELLHIFHQIVPQSDKQKFVDESKKLANRMLEATTVNETNKSKTDSD